MTAMRRLFRPVPLTGAVVLFIPAAAACGVLGLTYELWGLLAAGFTGTAVVVALWWLDPEIFLPAGKEVAHCPTSQLCLSWRKSQHLLDHRGSAHRKATLSRLRASYLDELERRDPEGFVLWVHDYLHATPCAPEDYIFSERTPRT
ncbi:MAG: hypothetical protein J2P17_04500 [Mycobacterium sp.]|nr:hypothetical protein [Mycobacterium sp.]